MEALRSSPEHQVQILQEQLAELHSRQQASENALANAISLLNQQQRPIVRVNTSSGYSKPDRYDGTR